MANHGQALSGNQVAQVDANDGKPVGKPHRNLMSGQSAEQPKPADSPSPAPSSSESSNPVHPLSYIAKERETIGWWTSSFLLCAFVFVLSVYAFNGKVYDPELVHSFVPCCAQLPLLPCAAPAPPT